MDFNQLKVAFFQKVRCVFQISKNKYSKSLSWTWNLNFLPITVNNKFKFQAQDRNLEYVYFGDLEIWKTNHTFWKKATFSSDILVIFHISAARHTLAQKLAMKKNLFSLWKHKMTLLIDLHSWNFCYFSCLAKYLLHTIFLIHNEMLKCNGHDIQCTSFCKKEKVGLFSFFCRQMT